jgi:hypothetical protein
MNNYIHIFNSIFSDKILNGLACPCKLGCMNTVYEVEKLQDAQYENIILFDSK